MKKTAPIHAVSIPAEIPSRVQNVVGIVSESLRKISEKVRKYFDKSLEVRILVNNWTIVYDFSREDAFRIFDMGDNSQANDTSIEQDINLSKEEQTRLIKNRMKNEWGVNVKEVTRCSDLFEQANFINAMQGKAYFVSSENPELSLSFAKACYDYRNMLEQGEIEKNSSKAVRVKVEKAQDFAIKVGYNIKQIRAEFKDKEKLTFERIAEILNEKGIPTPRVNSQWIGSSVFRIEKTFLELYSDNQELVHNKLHNSFKDNLQTSPS